MEIRRIVVQGQPRPLLFQNGHDPISAVVPACHLSTQGSFNRKTEVQVSLAINKILSEK
jgi:hypothetical protein